MIYKPPSHYLKALESNPDLTAERMDLEKPNEYLAIYTYTLDNVVYCTVLSDIVNYIASGDWLFGVDCALLDVEELFKAFFYNAVNMKVNPTAPAFVASLLLYGSEISKKDLLPTEDALANIKSVEINTVEESHVVTLERDGDLPAITFDFPSILWHGALMEVVASNAKAHSTQ